MTKEAKEKRSRGWAHRVGKTLVTLLVGAALACVVIFALGQTGVIESGDTRVDATTIQNSFDDIAELATEEYDLTNVGKYTKEEIQVLGVSVPFTGSSFLVTYSGTVKAGIKDINDIEVAVDDAAKCVIVSAPQVEIIDATIDPDTIEVYDQTFNPINQISVDDVSTFLASEEDNAKQTAIDNGILDKAQEHTEDILVAHVQALLVNSDEADYDVVVSWPES